MAEEEATFWIMSWSDDGLDPLQEDERLDGWLVAGLLGGRGDFLVHKGLALGKGKTLLIDGFNSDMWSGPDLGLGQLQIVLGTFFVAIHSGH